MLVPSPDGRHAPRIITDYDLVADGVRVDTVHTPPEAPLGEVALEDYRAELKKREAGRGTAHTITLRLKPAPSDEVQRCELFLSNMGPQIITGLAIHQASVHTGTAALISTRPARLSTASRSFLADDKPTMLVHGSSITHSVGIDSIITGHPKMPFGSGSAWSPSRTWPATAARLAGVEYISLGFAGQAVLDQTVARTIRDIPDLDCIALKLGINVHNHGCLGVRSFGQAALGFILTVRDGHPCIPLLIVSPVFGAWREEITYSETPLAKDRDEPDPRFPTLQQMRSELERVVKQLQARGDGNIRYVSGLELFSEADMKAGLAPDSLHPNGDGYELMGARFAKVAFGDTGLLLPGRLAVKGAKV